MTDHRDRVIAECVSGRSFAEVGGLWGAVNEKLTLAQSAGATDLCMIDIWKEDSEWWQRFRERCAERSISRVREIIGSIDSPQIPSRVGEYDIVHCSGVLYHCPNPFWTLRNLRSITKETLIIAVAVMPSVIETTKGVISLSDEAAICIPCIGEDSRQIADLYIKSRYGGGAWGVNEKMSEWYFNDGAPNYGPWWWLWTAGYFRKILVASGFDVTADFSQFDGTGHLYVCKKIADTQSNFGTF